MFSGGRTKHKGKKKSKFGYDPAEFVSLNAKTRYEEQISKIPVCVGRAIKFKDFTSYNTADVLRFQSWHHLFIDVEPAFPNMVHFFFANMTVSDDIRQIKSLVKGQEIILTPSILAEILNVPNEGAEIYRHTLSTFEYEEDQSPLQASALIRRINRPDLIDETRINFLNQNAYLLAKIIFDSIVPKRGDKDRARGCTNLLIYLLMSYQKVNLPVLMLECIADMSRSRSLPYGSFFTKIFSYFNCEFFDENQLACPTPFNKTTITSMLKITKKPISSMGEEEEEEELGSEESEEDATTHWARVEAKQERLQMEQEAIRREMNQGFADLRHDMNQGFTRIDDNFAALFGHFNINYPPPRQDD